MSALWHLFLILFFPPLLLGVTGKTKAWFAGRTGVPLFQVYWDLLKLLRKGAVYSQTATWLFVAGPIVSLASVLLAGLFLPLVCGAAPLHFTGDLILFAALLGLGRFFTVLAALDTGSSFEGMGASREMTFAALAEPALILALLILSVNSQTLTLSDALQPISFSAWRQAVPLFFCLSLALGVVLLAENARLPVDDPATHLELTMIHEVMVLDHSGVDLAFILYGSAIKFFLMATMIVRILVPLPSASAWAAPVFLAGVMAVAVAVGIIESITARLRLTRVPQFLLCAFAMSALCLCLLFWRGLP